MPVRTEETHRATFFEIFFDLVFVFALTRVILLMGSAPTATAMARGLLLLMLLWISWSNYTWLANQVRADFGVIRAGIAVAMAAIFVVALVIPDAWRHDGEGLDAPLTLALAYVALTALHLLLYFYAAMGDRELRTTVSLFAAVTALAWVPLVLGALLAVPHRPRCGRPPSSSPSSAATSPRSSADGRCAAPATSPNATAW